VEDLKGEKPCHGIDGFWSFDWTFDQQLAEERFNCSLSKARKNVG